MLDVLRLSDVAIDIMLINCVLAYAASAALSGGAFNVAYPGFMGVGAYSAGILSGDHGWHPIMATLAGIAVALLAALLLQVLLRRLDGVYLAVASVGFVVLIGALGRNLTSITGGAIGLHGFRAQLSREELVLLVAVIAFGFFVFGRSRLASLVAIRREDPELASALGLKVDRMGTILVMVSAGLGALGGSVRAYWLGGVSPGDYVFTLVLTLMAMVVVGGVGHWSGPLIGAAIFTALPEWTRDLGTWRDIGIGAIVLVIVRFAPGGIAGTFQALWARRRMRTMARAEGRGGGVGAPLKPLAAATQEAS